MYCKFLILFSLFLPILCENSNPPFRWPYHEIYTGTMKSASFSLRLLNNFTNDDSDSCLENSTSCLENSTSDNLINFSTPVDSKVESATIVNEQNGLANKIFSSVKEETLKYILERTDLLKLIFSGKISMDCLADLYYFAESVQKLDHWALKGKKRFFMAFFLNVIYRFFMVKILNFL